MSLTYLLTFSRVVIGLVFLLSAVSKSVDIASFRTAITRFGLVPRQWVRGVTLGFVLAEWVVVALVVAGGRLLPMGFALAILLLVVFCVALVSVLLRNIKASCNCFGPTAKQISHYDVGRNVIFILCALAGWIAVARLQSGQQNLGLGEVALIGLGAAAFVTVWINLQEIVLLFRQR